MIRGCVFVVMMRAETFCQPLACWTLIEALRYCPPVPGLDVASVCGVRDIPGHGHAPPRRHPTPLATFQPLQSVPTHGDGSRGEHLRAGGPRPQLRPARCRPQPRGDHDEPHQDQTDERGGSHRRHQVGRRQVIISIFYYHKDEEERMQNWLSEKCNNP